MTCSSRQAVLLSRNRPSGENIWFQTQVRHFAKKRKKLDEYADYELDKSPKALPVETFVHTPIHLQTASELVKTIDTAATHSLTNANFWKRCATAVIDFKSVWRCRELATIVNAFAKVKYADSQVFDILSKFIALKATEFRPSEIAVIVNSYGRVGRPQRLLFDVLAQEIPTKFPHMGPKGITMVATGYAKLGHVHTGLMKSIADEVVDKAHSYSASVCFVCCFCCCIV